MRPQPDTGPKVEIGRVLDGRAALITGGDSGIGRAVAVAFAHAGADVAVVYAEERDDAAETKRLVEEAGTSCLTIEGDVGREATCRQAVRRTMEAFGRLDVLVNNAGEQHPQKTIADIQEEQLERTFRTNIFAMFFATKAALEYLQRGGSIVNTASVTAYKGGASGFQVGRLGLRSSPPQWK